jgi:hypothetical protein
MEIKVCPWLNLTIIFSTKAFAQIFFYSFKGIGICQKCTKISSSAQKLQSKMCSKISAEMLVKQNSIFCAIYLILLPFYFEIWLVK